MSVVIRLMRAGAKKRPFYRVVAADSRRQRDGRFLEILGHYNPLTHPFELVVHRDKVEKWIERGAQPSEQAASLFRTLGIVMHRPSRPTKPVAEASTPAAKKAAPKRAVRRQVSDRKAKKKAAVKVAKAGGKPIAAKGAKKKAAKKA